MKHYVYKFLIMGLMIALLQSCTTSSPSKSHDFEIVSCEYDDRNDEFIIIRYMLNSKNAPKIYKQRIKNGDLIEDIKYVKESGIAISAGNKTVGAYAPMLIPIAVFQNRSSNELFYFPISSESKLNQLKDSLPPTYQGAALRYL